MFLSSWEQRRYALVYSMYSLINTLTCHPALDYQVAESLKLELDYSDETSDFRKTNFPARHIYERTLPEIVGKHSNIFYHRASPYSGQGKPTTDRTLGDIHQCMFYYHVFMFSFLHQNQGMYGTAHKNPGITGIFWLVVSSRNSGCK
jgi:hypothetical protein